MLVQADAEYQMVERSGRYSIERDIWGSPKHFEPCLMKAQELCISGLRLFGYEYAGNGFTLRGPLQHMEFSASAAIDVGPAGMPGPLPHDPSDEQIRNYEAAVAVWNRAERTRAARKIEAEQEMIDFQLIGLFRKKLLPTMRTTKGTVVGGVSPTLAGSTRLITAKR